MNHIIPFLILSILILSGCSSKEDYTIDNGDNIRFVFDEGLNDDSEYQLPKDSNGYYHFTLYGEHQSIQRISVRLLNGDDVVYSKGSGYRHLIEWNSNLYWWLLEGDTVANITYTYFNPFTGEIQYVNLPPIINWEDVLVPTINSSSYTDEDTGRGSTVISPVTEMKGDTMKIIVEYHHSITRQEEGSSYYEVIGTKTIMDSISVILK